jgi:hypothetical protein
MTSISKRHPQGLGDSTAEARRTQGKDFFNNNCSVLRELCVSAVNISSQGTRGKK